MAEQRDFMFLKTLELEQHPWRGRDKRWQEDETMMLASYQTDASINVKKSDPSSSFQVGGRRLGPF